MNSWAALACAAYICGIENQIDATKMTNALKKYTRCLILTFTAVWLAAPMAFAQPGGGFGDPAERINRQKQHVLDSIPDLTEDQKLIIDQIFAVFTEQVVALRDGGDFATMREQMPVLAQTRDAAMKDLLTDAQYARYDMLLQEGQRRMRERMNNRNGRGGRGRSGGNQ